MPFSYGCGELQSRVYVYRMTLTDEDGHSIDYAWDDVVKRCKELGVDHVPHIRTMTLNDLKEDLRSAAVMDDIRTVKETFAKLVPLTPNEYRESTEGELNEMRVAAGIDTKPVYTTVSRDLQALQAAAGIL